jgi:ribonuclease-3
VVEEGDRPAADGATRPAAVLDALAERLGHPFVRPELLELALTHRSWCAENAGHESNERLEFLGDSVLGLVVTEHLYERYPHLPEGELAKARSGVVSAIALAEAATELALGPALRLGRGEHRSGGRAKPSILADALEAVIGAVHLDGGIEASRRLVLSLLAERTALAAEGPGGHDHKTRLQELAARRWDDLPVYDLSDEGPDHAKTFHATVRVGGRVRGAGAGRSKKQAEQAAARAAWDHLVIELADDTTGVVGSSRATGPAERSTDA